MLLNQLERYKIILASGSPRRRELMISLGLNFDVRADIDTDESFPSVMAAEDVPLFLATKKSLAFPEELNDNEILITADTIVAQDGKILLKPSTEKEAFDTLQKLSGNSHFVYTGVYLRSSSDTRGFVSCTNVKFGFLSSEEIIYYIQKYKPFDKAGAYGIQEWIGYVGVEEISGSYFNVMGLPIHKLYRELEEFIKE